MSIEFGNKILNTVNFVCLGFKRQTFVNLKKV